MQETIVSETYRLTPAAYFRIAAGDVLPKLLMTLAILILAASIGAIFDLRCALVALILIFLVAPFTVGHIYFSRLLTPQAQRALSPKHVTIVAGTQITETPESADGENTPLPEKTYMWNEITDVGIRNRILTIRFGQEMLAIPLEAISGIDPYALFAS